MTFISKFAIKSLLNIPPHLKCVATLPCEISIHKISILKHWVKLLPCSATQHRKYLSSSSMKKDIHSSHAKNPMTDCT